MFFNAQSLLCKLSDLNLYLQSKRLTPLIVSIVETWLTSAIDDACVGLPNYNKLRFDRPSRGGGVMLLIHNLCHIVGSWQLSFGPIQVLYADVKCRGFYSDVIRVVYVYRPPNTDMDSSLLFIESLESNIAPLISKVPTFIMGEFNLTRIDWSVPCTLLNHTRADKNLLLLQDAYFTDLLFVSHPNLVFDTNVTVLFSISDHATIECDIIVCKCATCSSHEIPLVHDLDFHRIDHAGFTNEIIHTDWDIIFKIHDDINLAWNSFSNYIMLLIKRFTPLRSSKVKLPQKNYFPLEIKQLIHLKNTAWFIYKKFKRDCDKTTFRNLAKLVRKRVANFRRVREERILRSASAKQFYAYARECFGSNKQSYPILDVHKDSFSNDVDEANALNSFFHSVYSPDNNILPDFPSRTNANKSLPSFTSGEVRLALLEVKKSNACGPDGCPSLFLSMFPELFLPLANLFNMSLLPETVPNEWKLAYVIPVYKSKGAKTTVENYRPISLTNNFCKIMEKLIKIKMIDYLNSNALLSYAQSGFTAGRSTLSKLLLAQHVLVDSFNDRACVDVLFTDLSKAFDSIAHNKLILKLSAYGLNPSVCGWIKSFLSDRKQRVVVNGSLSTWLSCPTGVPQGSVLGPLLFNLYVNDMPDKLLNSSIFLYADDAKLLKRVIFTLNVI